MRDLLQFSMFFSFPEHVWMLVTVSLTIIALARGLFYSLKKKISRTYAPIQAGLHDTSVSVIVPVLNEDTGVLKRAIASWKQNAPLEIIVVLDAHDAHSEQWQQDPTLHIRKASLPGKRHALAEGIRAARGDVIALVDSDTVWSENMLSTCLSPFHDPLVGAVTVRERVRETRTPAQKTLSMLLEYYYSVDLPFLAALKSAFFYMSGRTTFYRKQALLQCIDALVEETFLGKQCMSGDDISLTGYCLERGWHIRYQSTASVEFEAAPDLKTLCLQMTRWVRNSWRGAARTTASRWLWRNEWPLMLYMLNKGLQFVAILAFPPLLLAAIAAHQWPVASLIALWCIGSCGALVVPRVRSHVQEVSQIPMYLWCLALLALMRVYALLTVRTQQWLTRSPIQHQALLYPVPRK